jgi:hypothetical protein
VDAAQRYIRNHVEDGKIETPPLEQFGEAHRYRGPMRRYGSA